MANLVPKNQAAENPQGNSPRIKKTSQSGTIGKTISSKVRAAVMGASLVAGSANAVACTEYVHFSMEANINVHEIAEVLEKGPILSNQRYDEKNIGKAVEILLNGVWENRLQASQFVDTSAFKTRNALKPLSKEVLTANLVGKSYRLIDSRESAAYNPGDKVYNLSFRDLTSDKVILLQFYDVKEQHFIATTSFEKDIPVKTLYLEFEEAQKKGFVKIIDKDKKSTFISPDGFKIDFLVDKKIWQDVTGKNLGTSSLEEMKQSAVTIGHNGLLERFLEDSEKPSWAPGNLQEMLKMVEKLPSNSPEAFEAVIKKVLEYRKDPVETGEYQYRHPDMTLAEGFADCDDYTIIALIWAKANGFKARVARINGLDIGHVLTRVVNPKTGEIFMIDNSSVEIGEEAYQLRIKKYLDANPSWTFSEVEYL